MNQRLKYKTKQQNLLVEYLKSVSGKHVTAYDVCNYAKEAGLSISKATIYRQLESLVGEGVLNKYIIDAGSPACFEYVGADAHADAEVCFHCKCEVCGRLIHLHCEELEGIAEHLFSEHRFRLNPMRTVFYGLCEQCSATA